MPSSLGQREAEGVRHCFSRNNASAGLMVIFNNHVQCSQGIEINHVMFSFTVLEEKLSILPEIMGLLVCFFFSACVKSHWLSFLLSLNNLPDLGHVG